MPEVAYQPSVGRGSGIERLLRSAEMQRFMAGIGSQGARLAAGYTPDPTTISSTTTMAFGRWCANVANDDPDAMRIEYGGAGRPPLHPLARVLDQLWVSDPNRRKQSGLRLSGR